MEEFSKFKKEGRNITLTTKDGKDISINLDKDSMVKEIWSDDKGYHMKLTTGECIDITWEDFMRSEYGETEHPHP